MTSDKILMRLLQTQL